MQIGSYVTSTPQGFVCRVIAFERGTAAPLLCADTLPLLDRNRAAYAGVLLAADMRRQVAAERVCEATDMPRDRCPCETCSPLPL